MPPKGLIIVEADTLEDMRHGVSLYFSYNFSKGDRYISSRFIHTRYSVV